MNQLKASFSEYKNSLYLLGIICISFFVFDLCTFNQAFLINKFVNLQTKRYSITDGSLYEFNVNKGKLIAQGYDPNVTFDNVNLPVASVSIDCDNSAMKAIGQVFYRSNDEVFSESQSVVYDTSLHAPIILVLNSGIPGSKIISSLRLDLTNVSGDKIICGEFVVNPQVTYNLDITRLIVYFGFSLALILYVFRNVYMRFLVQTKYEKEIISFAIIEILQVVLFKSLNVPLNDQYVVLKLIILTGVSLSLSFSLSYIDFSRFFKVEESDSSENKSGGLFLFVILVVITYFPVISTKYFHHDDYLNYTGLFQNIFPASVGTGRIGAGLYVDMLYKLTVETSYIGRIIALVGILLIFLLFNKWMEEIGYGRKISLILPFLCAVSLPFLNIGAYVVEFSFIWGGLFSALSVVMFFKSTNSWAERNYKAFSIYILMSLFSLLLSLFIYQATSTVGLGLLVAYLMKPKDDWQKIFRTGLYYGFFGVVAVLYLFINKIIWAAYHMPATSRTQMISSFSDVIQKISWFVTYVFPQSARQVVFVFGGKFLFTQEWSLITLTYRNPFIGFLIEIAMLGVVILGCFYRINKRSSTNQNVFLYHFMSMLLLVASIPYSYFYLLVAKESSYLTFYVSGMVFVMFVILVVCGNQILQHVVASPRVTQRAFTWAIVPMLVIVSFNSNRYLYTMWVRPNDISYTYIKNILKNSDKASKRIHIIGSTGEVDVYWINAARMALLEIGEDTGQYKISYADSEYMINLIEQSRFDYFSQSLSSEDLEFVRSHYILNTSFSYYYLDANAISADDLQYLETIFEKLDVIPTEDDRAIVVDMRKIR